MKLCGKFKRTRNNEKKTRQDHGVKKNPTTRQVNEEEATESLFLYFFVTRMNVMGTFSP